MTRDRTPLDEHIADATALLAPLRRERVLPLGAGVVGTVALAPRRSLVDVPSCDNSQMDGYAVAADALGAPGEPVTLPVGPMIPAGSAPGELAPGTAAPIMTGAPLPAGADLVVPVEEADGGVFADGAVVSLVPSDVAPGRFVRARGSDTARGDTVLREDEVLSPGRIAHLAACGITDVDVHEPIRVLVLSTGSEVSPISGPLPAGGAYDANGPGLAAALSAAGTEVVTVDSVPDDPQALLERIRRAVREKGAQLIVTSGGVSKGAVEPVRLACADADVELVLTAVAMQPGGPQGLGTVAVDGARIPWLAFPGNPVSALLSCELIARPALGAPARMRLRLPIALETDESSPVHLTQYRRARVLPSGRVRLVGGPSSHLIGSLARADALVEVPVGTDVLHDGDPVTTILLPQGER